MSSQASPGALHACNCAPVAVHQVQHAVAKGLRGAAGHTSSAACVRCSSQARTCALGLRRAPLQHAPKTMNTCRSKSVAQKHESRTACAALRLVLHEVHRPAGTARDAVLSRLLCMQRHRLILPSFDLEAGTCKGRAKRMLRRPGRV